MATASLAPPGQLQIPAWLHNSAAEDEAARTARPSPLSSTVGLRGGRRERDPSSAAGPQGTDQRTKKPRGGKAANDLGQQSQQINIISDDDDFEPTTRQQQRPSRTSSNTGRAQPSR